MGWVILSIDAEAAAPHLKPLEFNKALEEPGTIIVDMRNHYESEVRRFERYLPHVPTFREELPLVAEMLKDKQEKILIYCTPAAFAAKRQGLTRKATIITSTSSKVGLSTARRAKKEQLPSSLREKISCSTNASANASPTMCSQSAISAAR